MTEALLAEAVQSGYEAIALTVDAPVRGPARARPADGLRGGRRGAGGPGGDRLRPPGQRRRGLRLVDPSLDWDALAALCRGCELPILFKGLMAPADAELAIEAGAGGIVVSNHGGRQLDGVPATIDALPAVADAVAGRVPVLMDGGVRRGTDVLVALALGADAVLVGRPALWGLAVDGEQGARQVLELLRDEIKLALALLGCPTPADARRHGGAARCTCGRRPRSTRCLESRSRVMRRRAVHLDAAPSGRSGAPRPGSSDMGSDVSTRPRPARASRCRRPGGIPTSSKRRGVAPVPRPGVRGRPGRVRARGTLRSSSIPRSERVLRRDDAPDRASLADGVEDEIRAPVGESLAEPIVKVEQLGLGASPLSMSSIR